MAISLTTGEAFAAVISYKRSRRLVGKPSPEPLKRLVAELKAAVDEAE